MNRRIDTITVGRGRRPVAVERRPLAAKPVNGRRWSRGEVHEAGTIAVADALCPMGGLMMAERGRELDRKGVRSGSAASGRKSEENASAIKALDCDLRSKMPGRESGADVLPRSLAADVERVLRGRTDFPRTLWGEVI